MEHTESRIDTCDVVVVGAGLVGAVVAARLAETGKQVAVLDAQGIAGGATGRSAGVVIAGLPGHYSWAVEKLGREQARALWQLASESRDELAASAIHLGVYVEHSGSLALAVTEQECEALRTSARLLQQDGFAAQFESPATVGRGFLAGLHCPDDLVVDAAGLTAALLHTAPIAIHTDSEVYDLEAEGEMVRVWARGRNVRCREVVLAVDGYAPLLERRLAEWIAPGRALSVVTAALPEIELPCPCTADYGYEYACQFPGRQLVLGAWRRPPTPSAASDEPLRDGLARFVNAYFPEIAGHVELRQSGAVGLTPDGLPIIGRLPDLPAVHFALGFGGWGLSWAFAAAERLVDWMLSGAEPGMLAVERLKT